MIEALVGSLEGGEKTERNGDWTRDMDSAWSLLSSEDHKGQQTVS